MDNLPIDSRYNASISRFFSTSILNSLVRKGYSDFFNETIHGSGLTSIINREMTLSDLLQRSYEHLCKNYRSEYVYKNAIANNILLGKHSLNTSFMLTEFRVANCKADVVVLNGTSCVYEVKSEFDSMERIKRQIGAYEMVFDETYIITSQSNVDKVEASIPPHVGIKVSLSNKNNTISKRRDAQSCKQRVKPAVIFDSLRKSEYIAIIKDIYGSVPDVPNTQIHKASKELFCKLPPEKAHSYMVETLKKRGDCLKLKEFIHTAPECLRAYALHSGLKRDETVRFMEMLNLKCKDLINPIR